MNYVLKIITVTNQKGGVAKTTTVGALAAGLKSRGYKTLAIDLDPQGNLSNSVGAEAYTSYTAYEVLKKKEKAQDVKFIVDRLKEENRTHLL